MAANRQVKLIARPKPGPFARENFAIEDAAIPEPGPRGDPEGRQGQGAPGSSSGPDPSWLK